MVCADPVCHIPADSASHLAEMPLVGLDIALFPRTIASDVVLLGHGMLRHVSLAGHTCWSTTKRFTDSPFEFTKSNEDMMWYLFAKI